VTAHSKLGASSSHRWWNCPGSLRMSEGIEARSSKYAEEGTAAHSLAEYCLRFNHDAAAMIGTTMPGYEKFPVDAVMAENVQVYLDLCTELGYPNGETECEIEARFDLSALYPGMFGTADFVAYHPETRKLTVVDFKYGQGVAVEPQSNPQLLYYALGSMQKYHNRGLTEVELIVVQPRCPHPDGPVRRWSTTAVDLHEWSVDLIDAAKRTEDPDAPLNAGEWCRFCPAYAICPKAREKAAEVAAAVFSPVGDMELPADPKRLTQAQIGRVLREAYFVRDWVKQVEQFAYDEAQAGRIPEGFVLQEGRAGRRKWKDEDEAAFFLESILPENDVWVRSLKSPAQIEPLMTGKNKKQRAAVIAKYVEQEPGKPNLVPVEQATNPIRPAVETVFQEVA
jgi:hypothetical protein